MARHPRSVDEAIARFDDLVSRIDGRPAPHGVRRDTRRTVTSVARRLANIGVALAVLVVATIAFGLFVGPIGWTGLFLVALAMMCVLVFFSSRSDEPKRVAYSDELPTKQVIRQADGFLSTRRSAVPPAAARRLDAIGQQLPLLESRLGEADMFDPLAQDARRLLGKHLPELIERYERVPPAYRAEKDAEGLTVDERLVAGLDAARNALDDIGSRLTKQDRDAFEVQGRFIESRYKDGAGLKEE